MKVLVAIAWLMPSVSAIAAADEPISYGQGVKLMAKYGCQACHDSYKTLGGPALRAIARRYASDPAAGGELETKVLNGSTGAWGPSSMAPVLVPDEDLKVLVEWILSLK